MEKKVYKSKYDCPVLIPEVLLKNGIEPDRWTHLKITDPELYAKIMPVVWKAAILIEKDLTQNPYHKYLQEHLRVWLPQRYAYIYAVDKDLKDNKRKELIAKNDSGVSF